MNKSMGIDKLMCEAVFRSLEYVKERGSMLTLGRQGIHVHPDVINMFLEENKYVDLKDKYVWGYCEELFKDIGFSRVDSLDYSNYENASIIHNFNTPVSNELHCKYSLILDGGTTEHLFNTPQVCENIINLLEIGGVYVSVTPNNNLSGHGIYQFSPEFFLSAFSLKYGMEVQELYLAKVESKFKDWLNVNDRRGGKNGRNITKFDGDTHVCIIAIIRKVTNERENLLVNSPNQYSYENVDWAAAGGV